MKVLGVIILIFVCLWVFRDCGRSDECQAIFDRSGSAVGAYMEEGGYC